MKRIFTFGFQTRLTTPALTRLRHDPDLQVLRSYPDTASFHSLEALNLGQFEFIPTPLPEEGLRYMDAHFAVFCRLFNRQDTRYQSYRYFTLESAYMSLMQHLYRHLKEDTPDAVVFSYCPHSPSPFVMYHLCKWLNITTIILRESHFPGKICYFTQLEDFGTFEHVPALYPEDTFEIPEGHNVTWYLYEQADFYKPASLKDKLIRVLKQYPFVRTFGDALRFDGFPFKTFLHPFSRYSRLKHYSKTLASITSPTVDLDRNYVYFALNYQPELTTTLFGSDFQDMAYALESLSALIPNDWVVYAKEHPRQSDYQREPALMARMAALKNVVFVPKDMPSLDLIKHAQFNATVSGSTGWESICGGKPALVFGLPWYLSFPGITRYSTATTVEDVLSNHFTHSDINAHYKTFSRHLADGALESSRYPTFGPHNPFKLDLDTNAKQITSLIKRLLEISPS